MYEPPQYPTAQQSAVEQVSVGRPPTKRRGTAAVLVIALVVGLVFVLLAILGADWAARNVSMNALVNRISVSEAAMSAVEDKFTADLDAFAKAQATDPNALETLKAQIKKDAEAGAAAVTAAGLSINNLRILPWDQSVTAARNAYLAHNLAWQQYLWNVSNNPQKLMEVDPAIGTTWDAMVPLLKEAVPNPALFDLKKRVNKIVDDGSAPADDSGGSGGGGGGGTAA